MPAEIAYPYKKNEYGIASSRLLPLFPDTEKKGVITSESGLKLKYRRDFNESKISDFREPWRYFLTAYLNEEAEGLIARFHFTTKDRTTGQRHPDLFAGKFADLVFQEVSRAGRELAAVKDVLMYDNLATFLQGYQRHHDLFQAAQDSWIGQLARRNGFPIVQAVKYGEGDVFAQATFGR